ncbi:MAG: DNA polymerase III subunit epsilon, partial [Bacteroidetes bacterium QH_2_63_10]
VRNTDQAEMVVDVIGRFFQLRECDDERLHLGQRCLYADMDRCTAPCETDDPEAYAEVVERVRAFLTGRDPSVLDALRDRMRRASDQLDFEKAAQIRDTVEQLERILEKQRVAAAPVRRHNAALVHHDNDWDGRADVLLVRFGRFEEALQCTMPPTAEDQARLREHCHALFDLSAKPPNALSKRDATEIRLLSHWTYAHRDELTAVRWTPDHSPEALATAIEETLAERQEAAA